MLMGRVICGGIVLDEIIGINVGSGQRPFDNKQGWINVDVQDKEHPDILAEGTGLPFKDNFADYVCLHQILEHYGCGESDGLIEEAHRVLKPEGSLLVFVPDIKKLADRWINGGDPSISDFIFKANMYGAYQGSEYDRHKWGFHQSDLEEYLTEYMVRIEKPWDYVGLWTGHRPLGSDIAWDWWVAGVECIK